LFLASPIRWTVGHDIDHRLNAFLTNIAHTDVNVIHLHVASVK